MYAFPDIVSAIQKGKTFDFPILIFIHAPINENGDSDSIDRIVTKYSAASDDEEIQSLYQARSTVKVLNGDFPLWKVTDGAEQKALFSHIMSNSNSSENVGFSLASLAVIHFIEAGSPDYELFVQNFPEPSTSVSAVAAQPESNMFDVVRVMRMPTTRAAQRGGGNSSNSTTASSHVSEVISAMPRLYVFACRDFGNSFSAPTLLRDACLCPKHITSAVVSSNKTLDLRKIMRGDSGNNSNSNSNSSNSGNPLAAAMGGGGGGSATKDIESFLLTEVEKMNNDARLARLSGGAASKPSAKTTTAASTPPTTTGAVKAPAAAPAATAYHFIHLRGPFFEGRSSDEGKAIGKSIMVGKEATARTVWQEVRFLLTRRKQEISELKRQGAWNGQTPAPLPPPEAVFYLRFLKPGSACTSVQVREEDVIRVVKTVEEAEAIYLKDAFPHDTIAQVIFELPKEEDENEEPGVPQQQQQQQDVEKGEAGTHTKVMCDGNVCRRVPVGDENEEDEEAHAPSAAAHDNKSNKSSTTNAAPLRPIKVKITLPTGGSTVLDLDPRTDTITGAVRPAVDAFIQSELPVLAGGGDYANYDLVSASLPPRRFTPAEEAQTLAEVRVTASCALRVVFREARVTQLIERNSGSGSAPQASSMLSGSNESPSVMGPMGGMMNLLRSVVGGGGARGSQPTALQQQQAAGAGGSFPPHGGASRPSGGGQKRTMADILKEEEDKEKQEALMQSEYEKYMRQQQNNSGGSHQDPGSNSNAQAFTPFFSGGGGGATAEGPEGHGNSDGHGHGASFGGAGRRLNDGNNNNNNNDDTLGKKNQ